MKTSSKDILANIIKIRNDRGLTQAAVADSIEVDYSSYSKLESGVTKLSLERLEKIASFFNMDLIYILTYPQKYVPYNSENMPETSEPKIVVQIELDIKQKEEVLKLILGEQNTSILLKK